MFRRFINWLTRSKAESPKDPMSVLKIALINALNVKGNDAAVRGLCRETIDIIDRWAPIQSEPEILADTLPSIPCCPPSSPGPVVT